ncbi:ankyrin repeat domain-containing protein, chloroplastic-like [Vigna unguiculata]|uniref:ankyrin repeat domain-containing protein, chloroplastic-like n=1 Tax=Vigna unguiculata TaxID=3917 RepID=UPI001016689E|nr:ankyrin repeat domain-containing protein, chloroplastic-like [Vigna unguiculata]XP_027915001.1 ankyrin repeat domain-containing protein, chloroplastic-like [Vigna unguiculata]XP_027915002.1 ankyrin repeat domain-containing protein, chloroplastic-like [Vigna unguiculata]XP_027915003.1 ankyrin repeat domain-containing protein, chloroplastic-like [Vigna unguiculata]
MEAAMFNFSTVLFNAQPHNLFSHHINFPLAISPLRFQSLQSLQFPAKWNAHSQKNRNYVIFEDGIFENGAVFLNDNNNPKPKTGSGKKVTPINRENLVPDKWREAQAETKITINKRRKKKNRRGVVPFSGAEKIRFNGTVEKKRKENGKVSSSPYRDVNWNEYKASKKEILKKLNPLVLKNPSRFPVDEKVPGPDFNGERVEPKNPRGVVQGKSLEDVLQFFSSGSYNPRANTTRDGCRNLFVISKEEMFLLNKRMPDLATATSGKWLPLHTFAACGESFLLDSLLKHNVDINAVDKDGLTVLHKAIGKKQAITNYLLRNSANPFVKDKEGATLMHYAVQTGSTETIELLLFYNVDINLQDKDGWTPLHLAVQTQKPNVVRLLLLKGADKTLRNKDGLTPLDLCLYSGQSFQTYVIIKLLKQPQEYL